MLIIVELRKLIIFRSFFV